MKRTVDANLHGMRLAFWGYTNGSGVGAALNLARQLRRCKEALNGRTEINRFCYEMPERVDDLMALVVRGAGGPSHHDDGWDDLAAVLAAAGRGFEAIICERVDRLSPVASQSLAKERLASDHGAVILAADQPRLGLADVCDQELGQLWRQTLRWASGREHVSATSIPRGPRRCACG